MKFSTWFFGLSTVAFLVSGASLLVSMGGVTVAAAGFVVCTSFLLPFLLLRLVRLVVEGSTGGSVFRISALDKSNGVVAFTRLVFFVPLPVATAKAACASASLFFRSSSLSSDSLSCSARSLSLASNASLSPFLLFIFSTIKFINYFFKSAINASYLALTELI